MKGLRPGWWLAALLSLLFGGLDSSAIASSASAHPAGRAFAPPAPDVQPPWTGTAESAEPSGPLADAPEYGSGNVALRVDMAVAGLLRPLRLIALHRGTASGWYGLADLGTVPARPPPPQRP